MSLHLAAQGFRLIKLNTLGAPSSEQHGLHAVGKGRLDLDAQMGAQDAEHLVQRVRSWKCQAVIG